MKYWIEFKNEVLDEILRTGKGVQLTARLFGDGSSAGIGVNQTSLVAFHKAKDGKTQNIEGMFFPVKEGQVIGGIALEAEGVSEPLLATNFSDDETIHVKENSLLNIEIYSHTIL